MGKDKQKGLRSSSKPASSSEFTNTGFIGFSGSNQEGLDPEFENVFKGLRKKDSITKLKALQDFKTLFEKLDETTIPGVMKSWSVAYQRLGRDIDWKVRESTNQTFVELIKVVKKGLAPQLKTIFGTWLCNLFDTYREVSVAAKTALNTAFPEKKQAEAILFCSKEVLSFVQDTFEEIQAPAKSAEAPIKEPYERIVSTTIMALGYLIDNLSDSENQKLLENYSSLLSQKMWSFLTNKDYPLIRKAGYNLVAILSKKLPEFPNAWKSINPRKQTLPKLWELLRSAGYKSATITFNNLVPFLALIPADVVGEGPEFMKELFANIWEGFKKESSNKVISLEVLRGYSDCIKYFVSLARKLEDLALNEYLFLALEYFLMNELPSSKESLLMLSETFSRITFSNCSEESILSFWAKLASLSSKIFTEEKEKLKIFCINLGEFCGDIKTRYSSQQSDEKAIVAIIDFSKKTFSAAFPNAKSQEGIHSFLPLVSKLAEGFGLSSLLKGSSTGYDLFYRNQLVHWTTDWINSLKTENVRALFKFAVNYFKDPSVTDPHTAKELVHDWVSYLGLVVNAGQTSEGGLLFNLQTLEALLKEFNLAKNPSLWRNNALDELAKTLLVQFNIDSKVGSNEISLLGSIISYLIAGESNESPNLLQEQTQELILTSLSNSLNQLVLSPSTDKEGNALAILQCVEQILNAKSSEVSLKEVEWQLIVSIFSLRAYVRTDTKDDSETTEAKIRQQSIKIWRTVSDKFKNQITTHKGFSQSLISNIHNSLLGPMTSLTLKRIPLFGEQANTILVSFNDSSLIDSILLVQDRNQLHDSISKALIIDFIASDISYVRVHLQSEEVQESKLSNYFGILSFITQVLQHLQLNNLIDKENEEKRIWIPVELLFAHFIAEEHTKFRTSTKIIVNSFSMFQDNIKAYVEEHLVQELLNNPVLLENTLKVLVKESNIRGGFQALALRHILNLFKNRYNLFSSVVSKLPISAEEDVMKSDPALSTFQAIFPFLTSYKITSNLVSGYEPLLQNNPDELRRRVEIAFIQFSESPSQPLELLGLLLSNKQLLSYSKLETPQAQALYASIAKLAAKAISHPQDLLETLRSLKSSLVFAEENYLTLLFDICRNCMKVSSSSELELSVKYQALCVTNALRKSIEVENFATAVKNSVKLQREHDLFINEMYSSIFKLLGDNLEKQFGVYSSTILPLLSDITLRSPSTTLSKHKDLLFSLLTADNETLQVNSLSLLLRLLKEGSLVQISEKKSEDSTNLSEILVQIISSNPVTGDYVDNKFLGYLLGWSLVLSIYEQVKEMRSDISSFLRKENGLVTAFFGHLFDIIELNKEVPSDFASLDEIKLLQSHRLPLFASHLYFRILKNLPVLARTWWTYDLDRKWTANVDKYTKNISPFLIFQEVSAVGAFKHDFDNFKLKAGKREISASYEKDDVLLEIVIRLPESYPLRNVEVDYTKQTGASEALWRKWLLSMTTLLMTQDGSILDAVLLWKNSLDKHFEGVDVCPICYSLFDSSNRTLPNLACKTCKNKFHSSCMYKWIKVSHNSTCPLCKSPFN